MFFEHCFACLLSRWPRQRWLRATDRWPTPNNKRNQEVGPSILGLATEVGRVGRHIKSAKVGGIHPTPHSWIRRTSDITYPFPIKKTPANFPRTFNWPPPHPHPPKAPCYKMAKMKYHNLAWLFLAKPYIVFGNWTTSTMPLQENYSSLEWAGGGGERENGNNRI